MSRKALLTLKLIKVFQWKGGREGDIGYVVLISWLEKKHNYTIQIYGKKEKIAFKSQEMNVSVHILVH